MPRKEYLVEHSSQLNGLSTLPLARTPGLGTIRLGGVMARHPERERWERELNRSYHACGCDTGAKGLLLALVPGVAAGASGLSREAYTGLGAAGVGLGFALAGAVLGKLVGLVRAQRRLSRVAAEIQGAVREREPSVVEVWTCG